MSFSFAPRGWAQCNGQLLSIAQNSALFAILGTTYGGDGRATFALPDLRGRMPMHAAGGIALGQQGGTETETLTQGQTRHEHTVSGQTGPRSQTSPTNAVLASGDMYGAGPVVGALNSNALSSVGSSQAHNNMQPSLVINYCIALQGIFPSQN